MPFSAETTVLFRMSKALARLVLAAMLSIGLAGCGGGGSGGGGQVMIVPEPQPPAQEPQAPVQEPPPSSGESPDLLAESSSVNDPAPGAGADFVLSTRVRNAGGGSAAATTVRFYRSDDAAITPSDEEVGASPAAELAASGSVAASVILTAPSIPGAYYYGACVGAAPGESDAANNCSAPVLVTVSGSASPAAREQTPSQQPQPPALVQEVPKQAPARPDLVVESPAATHTRPIAGTGFRFSVSVRNADNGAAPATTARFYRSADTSISASDVQVGSKAVAWLAAWGSVFASLGLTAPSTPGTYYYGVCADAVDGESDAANNCSAPVRITVVGPPDLVALAPSFSTTKPFTRASFSASVTVRNDGGRRAGRSWLRVFRSADAAISTSDTQAGLSSKAQNGVGAAKSVVASVALTAPEAPGTYYYGVCADAVSWETEVANNCSPSVKITVRPPPPADLALGSVQAVPASPSAGGVFRLRTTVRNAGGRDTGATTVRYYRSTDATITTADTQVSATQAKNVPAWGSISSSTSSPYFLDTPPLGSYYYGACADAVTGESDTTNNCSAALKVEVTHAKPNLRFFSRGRNSRDGKFGLNVGVHNVGGPSPATTLRFYHSTDENISPSDTELRSVSVPALTKTESVVTPKFRSGNVYLPWPTTPGTHHYGACVDAVPGEYDTTDNCTGVMDTIRR